MPVPDFESLDDGCAESVWPGSAHATFWPVAAAIPTPTATTARPKRRGARLPCALRRAGTAINPLWHSVVVSRTSRRRGPADRRTRCRQHMTTCDINLRFVAESPVSSPFQDRCFFVPIHAVGPHRRKSAGHPDSGVRPIAPRCTDSQSGCGNRKASPQPHITGLLECGKHAFDHVVWISARAQEFELKHCALDLTGPAYPGGVGVLLYGVVD